MKALNYLFIITLLFTVTSCFKKEEYPTEEKILSVKTYKRLKTEKDYTATLSYTQTSISNYDYDDDGRIKTVTKTDSSNGGGPWTVSTSTTNYQYNSSKRWSALIYTSSTNTITGVTNYIYDSNGRIRYEIQTYGSNVDTIEYAHNNNHITSQPKYPGANYTKVYFTDGDPDSTQNYSGNVITSRTKYVYTAKINMPYFYFIPVKPLNPSCKEIGSIITSGNFNYTQNYTYQYDDEGYATKLTVTQPGQSYITTYTYY